MSTSTNRTPPENEMELSPLTPSQQEYIERMAKLTQETEAEAQLWHSSGISLIGELSSALSTSEIENLVKYKAQKAELLIACLRELFWELDWVRKLPLNPTPWGYRNPLSFLQFSCISKESEEGYGYVRDKLLEEPSEREEPEEHDDNTLTEECNEYKNYLLNGSFNPSHLLDFILHWGLIRISDRVNFDFTSSQTLALTHGTFLEQVIFHRGKWSSLDGNGESHHVDDGIWDMEIYAVFADAFRESYSEVWREFWREREVVAFNDRRELCGLVRLDHNVGERLEWVVIERPVFREVVW